MQQKSIRLLVASVLISHIAQAETLNTHAPPATVDRFSVPMQIDLPAQPLAASLRQLALQARLTIQVDSQWIESKQAPAISGRYNQEEILKRLLAGSELEGTIEDDRIIIKSIKKNQTPAMLELEKVEVRAKRFYEIGPLPGLGLTKEEIPGNVQSISAKEIKESKAVSLTDLMNSKLQSVNINDYQSNPFQMDVTYRGFTASPQLGTAQGLSVFLDGIRVNEPFGDVVNWDMIPMNALNSLDVFPGSNPLFGLGTLGGAISMKTKSGFDSNEGTVEYLGGSFKRNQFQGSVSGNNGVVAGFAAANIFKEDGWRVNSPSEVNQLFAKGEWRNDKLQLGLSMLYAGNKLVGNGLLPTELAQQDGSQIFTSPDETKNRLLQFQLNGIWDVSDTFNITGQIYNRKSKRNASTGDVNNDFSGNATRRAGAGEQVSPGFADINNDGLPDTTARINNVAIDQFGFLIDANGNSAQISQGLQQTGVDQDGNPIFEEVFEINDAFDPTNLAIGTNALTPITFTNGNQQSMREIFDVNGNSLGFVPNWGQDPNLVFNNPSLNPASPNSNPNFNPGDSRFYAFALEAWDKRSFVRLNDVLFANSGLNGIFYQGDVNNSAYYYNPTSSDLGQFDAGYLNANGFQVLINASAINPLAFLNPDGSPKLQAFTGNDNTGLGKPLGLLLLNPLTGGPIQRNGADNTSGVPGTGKGFVCDENNQNCTPNALITETNIDQTTSGGAAQLNWNFDKHKFMLGASIDTTKSTYDSKQRLGLFDENRNAYLDADRIGYEFAAASGGLGLNDFNGNGSTRSIYFSETWTPMKEWAFTASARYNNTDVRNELAINNILGFRGPATFLNFYSLGVLCSDLDGNGSVEASECPTGEVLTFTPDRANNLGAIGKGEVEKFNYKSVNPSLGATWQPNEKINLYVNWNRGARTPSVIELGCAIDDTPVVATTNADGSPASFRPRSLFERRFCTLPSILAGDPYLKQVRSETIELGGRGYLSPTVQWNATIYQTDLTDDIYFVSFTPDRSFFQNIGNTRRRGIEMGLQGKEGRFGFKLNYSLTDATFQDGFVTASPNNSSAGNVYQGNGLVASFDPTGYQQIAVKPGNRIPGVPLHNMNATISYEITPDWIVSLSGILHSESFVRGNENNQHKPNEPGFVYFNCSNAKNDQGVQFGNDSCSTRISRPSSRYPGKVPGYAVFNLKTSYKINKNWTAGLMINNLFDREYYSAGRLGINPFVAGPNGAQGPGGFNYNSNDWLASTFLAPGAPRSAFFTLTYDFDIGK